MPLCSQLTHPYLAHVHEIQRTIERLDENHTLANYGYHGSVQPLFRIEVPSLEF